MERSEVRETVRRVREDLKKLQEQDDLEPFMVSGVNSALSHVELMARELCLDIE